ncbi:hypothetical protein OP10G_4615 [Fimbriimonas ginsengisoli Gsoil 348]|uniref:Uncharacterized protein n=2 Tax=Fimbriimonas ginsengisoli TaxID=1005039 RepID=A0A068NWU0_FIMGI|nr:hypothetical protein OP10G_4615 [Fimbriimonas ginsengisoli Gsoil 348]
MVKIAISNEHQMTLDNGSVIEYQQDPKKHILTVNFPDGRVITYGYSRSGENLTLVDADKRIKYLLDQQ